MGAFPENKTETTAALAAALTATDAPRVALECSGSFDGLPLLLEAAGQWARSGGTALVVCPDAVALGRARAMVGVEPSGGEHLLVAQALDLAANLVETWGPVAGCPRSGRVLDANEMDVLIEDVKVTGLKTGRLKEMLKFFRKAISDGESRTAGWLVTGEEQKVFAVLEENLDARRALMPCEAAGFALSCIENPAVREQAPSAAQLLAPLFPAASDRDPVRVFAADFGALNRCAQELCLALADGGIVAMGRPSAGCAADEPYPCPEGFAQFAEAADTFLREETTPVVLADPIVAATPAEEFAAVADLAARLVAEGLSPADILVAVPNGIWAAQIARALERKGLPCRKDFGAGKIKGDPRLPGQHQQLRQATLAKLARNPRDLPALRTWLGLGDWLLASDAFLELMAWSRDHAMSPFDALDYLQAHPQEAQEMRGFAKLQQAMEALPKELDQLRQARSDEGLTTVAAPAAEAVTIAPYDRCRNQRARAVIITGMVDGFLPRPDAFSDRFTIDHQRKALGREKTLLEDIVAAATETAIPTLPQKDLLENADALGARITRITMEEGKRIATLTPSQLL